VSPIKDDHRRVDGRDVTAIGATAQQDATESSPSTPAAAPRPGASAARLQAIAKPQRSPELAHLTLDRLRTYRRTLLAEELRASYWRRLLQARRDLLRSGGEPGDRDALREVLTEARGAGRQVVLALHPDGGMPILPHLPELWASGVAPQDDEARAELFTKLASAESVLSSYREALHRRLDRATADLVARYHEDPRQCLVALPVDR
jgi:anti-sigma-K factor RsiG